MYARGHDGQFPPDDRATGEVREDDWLLPEPSDLRYLYVPGRRVGQFDAVLAYEPGLSASDRLVLMADGPIRPMSLDTLRKALAPPGGH